MDMLTRSGEPSKYDQSPYGTICKTVKTLGDTFEVYVQISEDDLNPSWEKVGIFSTDTSDETIQEEVDRVLRGRKVTVSI